MDIIHIEQLSVNTTIGTHPWERQIKQTLTVDLQFAVDACKAANKDTLSDTINYQALTDNIVEFISGSSYQLIESLAEHLAQFIQQQFAISWLRLTIKKPGALKDAKSVGITIERSKS